MKRFIGFVFVILSCIRLSAISLNLYDLERMMGSNIGTASIILAQKNYYQQYDNIVEDSDSNERVYVWSEDNSNYSDESEIWLSIYAEDNGNGAISYISLQCANLGDYAKITSDIPFLDYKFLRTSSFTWIVNNEKVSSNIYSGTKYMIEAETIKNEDDNSTIWVVDLFKKGGSWDNYNGKKKHYEDGSNLLYITYTVKDGYLAGEYIRYNTLAERDNALYSLWETASQEHELGDFNQFKTSMESPQARQNLYDAISGEYELGDYKDYDSVVTTNLVYANSHPLVKITPSDNRWYYETYSYTDDLIFKGYSAKRPIHMFESSNVDGYGTVRKRINGEWKSYTGKVSIRISAVDGRHLGIRVEPNPQ